MTILYITQNGITDHIGRSQVAPYIVGLANLGFSIHVLSAEKEGRTALVRHYRHLFDEAGVRWTSVRYRQFPPVLGQVWTQAAMQSLADRIVHREGGRLVHCRSFPPAVIGARLKRRSGVRFIFDFRDFYADGGLQKTRGLRRLAFRRMKQLEGPMIRAADMVVCLTERAREVLIGWYLADMAAAQARFQVIPCCADFTHFDPARLTPESIGEARIRAGIQPGETVLLYLGSLGPDYLLHEMMALFRQLLVLRPTACFLFVCNNGEDLVRRECAVRRIDPAHIRFISADRDDIPSLIGLADLSVIFIRADVSKAGCSPTKLAELFACNCPVIVNTGVGDLDALVNFERNASVVVHDFRDATLRAALEQVLARRAAGGTDIRANSLDMTLEYGVERYAAVYRELLAMDAVAGQGGDVPC